MGEIRRAATVVAYGIVYVGDSGVCVEVACTLNASTNHPERRMEVLNKIYNAMVEKVEEAICWLPPRRGTCFARVAQTGWKEVTPNSASDFSE